MKARSALVFAAMLAIASGCSGGGTGNGGVPTGGPPPPPPPPPPPSSSGTIGGLWSGAITWDPHPPFPGGALNVRALMTETGEFRWVLADDSEQLFGRRSEQIFGTLNAVDFGVQTGVNPAVWIAAVGPDNPAGERWGQFEMEGMYGSRDEIGATFWSRGANFDERWGDVTLLYHSLYERDSSLEILQGTYVTDAAALTIDASGAIFYQSSEDGCVGNGSAEVIDPDFNMYRFELALDNCTVDGVRNGHSFTGLAYVGENNDITGAFLNSTIEMALSASRVDDLGSSVYIPWSMRAQEQ